MSQLSNKRKLDDKQYGLDIIGRFADSISEKVQEIEKDLHYLHEWIRVTQSDKVSLSGLKNYKRKQ